MEEMSVYAGLLFFGMLYSPVETILGIFMQMTSRKHEYEADEYAANTIAKPEEMVHVLKKLSKDNLSNLTPHPFYVFLNYSRSEEHTSELQSRGHLVCRLLLEKKKKTTHNRTIKNKYTHKS